MHRKNIRMRLQRRPKILRQGLPKVKPVETGALASRSIASETTVCEAGNTLRG